MSNKDNGGQAFPWGEHGTVLGGMTLRDYFAAHAPETPSWWMNGYKESLTDLMLVGEHISRWRWVYADEMLKEREK